MTVEFYPGQWIPTPQELKSFTDNESILSFVDELQGEHEINIANGNAFEIIELLGYDTEELCGHAEASDFLGRVLVALAVAPKDEGMPAYQRNPGSSGAKIWRAARPEGYVQTRLEQLAELATFAAQHGYLVVWA